MFFDSMFWTTGQIGYYLLGKQLNRNNENEEYPSDSEDYNSFLD